MAEQPPVNAADEESSELSFEELEMEEIDERDARDAPIANEHVYEVEDTAVVTDLRAIVGDHSGTTAVHTLPNAAETLRELCEAQIATETDPERLARLHDVLGRYYEEVVDDPTVATAHYQASLSKVPTRAAAIRGARRTLAMGLRHAELPPLFDAEVELVRDPAARARLLHKKGVVYETRLQKPDLALAAYREAHKHDPSNVTFLKAIEGGQRRAQEWNDLSHTYERLVNAVSNATLKSAWTSARARLTEWKLKDPETALTLYQTALELDPHAADALAQVKRLSAEQGRWREHVAALEREHDLCGDLDARHGILTAIARVQERRIGDADAAISATDRALIVRPDDTELLRERARLFGRHGRHRDQANALAALAERTAEHPELASLCHRIGRIHQQELRQDDAARGWYARALSSMPGHRAAGLALANLLEQREDWRGLISVLSARADAITDPSDRGDLHHRIGGILERRMGSPGDAIDQHARALAFDANHHEAFGDMTRLLAAAGRWHELTEQFQRAVERAPHDAEAFAWLFRLGGVLEDRLGDAPSALMAYEEILKRDPSHLGALHAVQRAAERASAFPRVVAALNTEASLTADVTRRDALLHRAAVITLESLRDVSGAVRSLRALLDAAPHHHASLETLAEILSRGGRWEELVAIYARLLPLRATVEQQVRLLKRMGEVLAVQLQRDSDAIDMYRRALELAPGDSEASEALRSALEHSGRYPELAAALHDQLGYARAPAELARISTELGALYEDQLGDDVRALAAYAHAIGQDPLHRPALDARERLLTNAGDSSALVAALAEEAATTADPFLRTQAAFRSALLGAAEERPPASLLDAFRPVFGARPDHLGALLAVEEVYLRARDDAGLAATYDRISQVVGDRVAEVAALWSSAEALERAGSDASAVHRRILQRATDDPTALEHLVRSAEATGDVRASVATHSRLAIVHRDPSVAAHHHARVGQILLDSDDAGGGLEAFRAALALDGQNLIAARGLTHAAVAAADAGALQEASRYETQVTRDTDLAVRLLLRAGHIYYISELESSAATAYEEALALSPDSPEAATGLMAMMMKRELIPRLIELLTFAAHAATDPGRASVLHLSVALFAADLADDLPTAVAATKRALEARPKNENAHEDLATYLERNGQWTETADALERWIKLASERGLVAAHLRLARITELRLEAPERATASLRIVLEREPNNPEALASLARLERLAGRSEEALKLVRLLFSVIEDDVAKAAALAEMAELEKARGNLPAAAEAAYGAIEVQGPLGPGARFYRSLIAAAPEHATWDSYRLALMTYLPRAKRQGGDWAATYSELARIFEESSERPDAAIPALQEGSEACPDDASISLALVRALKMVGEAPRAMNELRRLLGVDVLEVGAWRALAELVGESGDVDLKGVVLAPLVALGQASSVEEEVQRNRTKHPGGAPPAMLDKNGLAHLIDEPILEDPATVFIPALADIITKLEGLDHDAWGISKRDRIRTGEPRGLRPRADQIARIFGVPEFDLYVTQAATLTRTLIVSGSPPALLVPKSLEHESDSVIAFHLARPLSLLSRQLHPLDHIDQGRLLKIMVASVRQFVPSFSLENVTDDDITAEMRQVKQAIGFFSRSRIQDAAIAFGANPSTNLLQWAWRMRRLAARAGLLVSDDLLASLEAIGEELGPDNYASDLARFWVSDPALRFRKAVKRRGAAPTRA